MYSKKTFSEMKGFTNALQESKQTLKQNFGVRIHNIYRQVIHLLQKMHTQACTHKDTQHRREWIKEERQSNDQIQTFVSSDLYNIARSEKASHLHFTEPLRFNKFLYCQTRKHIRAVPRIQAK